MEDESVSGWISCNDHHSYIRIHTLHDKNPSEINTELQGVYEMIQWIVVQYLVAHHAIMLVM